MNKFIISATVVLGLTGAAFAQSTTGTDRVNKRGDNVAVTRDGNNVDKTVTAPNGKSMNVDKTVNGNQATKTVTGSNGKSYSAVSTYGKNGVEKTQTAANGATRTTAHKRAKLR